MVSPRTIFGTYKNGKITNAIESIRAHAFASNEKMLEGQTGIFNIYYKPDFDKWVIFQFLEIDEVFNRDMECGG